MFDAPTEERSVDAAPTIPFAEPIQEPRAAQDRSTSPDGEPGEDARSSRALRLTTPVCFGIALLFVTGGVVLENMHAWSRAVQVVWIAAAVTFCLSTLTALWRALRGLVDAVQFARRGDGDVFVAVMDMLGNLFMACFGMLVAYLGTVGFSRGRQLRSFGKVLLPALEPNADWAGTSFALGGQPLPEGLADQWRENGKTEHASVAAFARLTLDLMALGAPPSLIQAANEDALDEIRHARLCFSLAAALDGEAAGPAAFPQAQRVSTLPRSRPLALAKLAVDSLVDGALHEGVSARIIAKLSHRCAVPAIQAALKEIAADEGRHAAHGWAVTRWCLEQGGTPVAVALSGALKALPREMHSNLPDRASEGAWERWGIHGHDLEAAEYTAARAHVVARVRVAVSTRAAAAA
jgi:hypothetical protein